MSETASKPAIGSRQIERMIMLLHDIAPEHEIAFMGRVKHFNRMGFPPGIKSGGRGNPIRYDADQTFQILLAFELTQFGVPPQRSAKLIEECWERVWPLVPRVWSRIKLQRRGCVEDVEAVYWVVPPEALRNFALSNRAYSSEDRDIIVECGSAEMRALYEQRPLNNYIDPRPLDWRCMTIHADKWIAYVINLISRHFITDLNDIEVFIGSMRGSYGHP